MVKKVLIWGGGDIGAKVCRFIKQHAYKDYKVEGVTDTYKNKLDDRFKGFSFIQIEKLSDVCFEQIIVANGDYKQYEEIKKYILDNLEFEENIIFFYEAFINRIRKEKLINIYSDSDDKYIKETLNWLKEHDLSVRNQYENVNEIRYEVIWEDGYPYTYYYGHKMYFPKDYTNIVDGKYIFNIEESDQYPGSPHLYITDEHYVKEGDVIVDCGVCEGNFALKYVDLASKIFLIESDPKWVEVLKKTFEPFGEKVKIVDKYLSDIDGYETVTLDGILKNEDKIDFIKMDIEGYETQALLGGLDILTKFAPKLSVCAYHRKPDEKYIKYILENLGYRTSVSNGYMYMLYDENIDFSNDFRHGVIYAEKSAIS